jgi:hypothetical protein
MMRLSPIALFTYNRLWHTKQTIESLQKNELAVESELFVFSDGPKSEADETKVLEVRSYASTIRGFKSVTLIESEENLGLARAIIGGVTKTINKYGRIIVLEDDMLTSPYFLRFMNEALEFYENAERVISIHGYIYPVTTILPETFFLKGADCWGWATWKRGWDLFESDGKKLLDEIRARELTRQFDFDGSYNYTKMLDDQVKGKNNSWAIRWNASAFLKNKLTLYPGKSLVQNIGIDSTGTHCGTSDMFNTEVFCGPVKIDSVPVEESYLARQAFKQYFRSQRSWTRLALNKLRLILRRQNL